MKKTIDEVVRDYNLRKDNAYCCTFYLSSRGSLIQTDLQKMEGYENKGCYKCNGFDTLCDKYVSKESLKR